MKQNLSERLGSLDVLRGFDLFVLVFFQPVFMALTRAVDLPWLKPLVLQFEHVSWEGFAFWDIIMPLFMFMAGASMPFAFAKYLSAGSSISLYQRILKRVILLWVFGMVCQGNLLALDPSKIYLYSNTLQAIAMGYLIAAIMLIHLKQNWQIGISAGLLLIYWGLLSFVKIEGSGGGNFSPDLNLAEYIDRLVLGRFRDRAVVTPDGIEFGSYRYTWILSSLNFGVTVMTGVFAGQILKSNLSKERKMLLLVAAGISMMVVGQLWGLHMPIIKKIWTSPMTLFSSGICFILMAGFYYLIDYKNYGRYLNWLKIYGMNSILAYMLFMVVNFSGVVESLLFGTAGYLGSFYPVLIKLGSVAIPMLILLLLHRNKIYLKV